MRGPEWPRDRSGALMSPRGRKGAEVLRAGAAWVEVGGDGWFSKLPSQKFWSHQLLDGGFGKMA